jgi:hypothetical protein
MHSHVYGAPVSPKGWGGGVYYGRLKYNVLKNFLIK